MKVTGIGQSLDDDFIVEKNINNLSEAAGTTAGDTLRFQITCTTPLLEDAKSFYVYRVHADGDLAKEIIKGASIEAGINDAGELQGKILLLECRGNHLERLPSYDDDEEYEESWELIWKVKAIERS